MHNFQDKYKLSKEQNLFLAKKKWDENIYCGMKMENRNITFPQTQTILNGVNVAGVALDDIQAVLNMRDGWRYLVSTIEVPITLSYICKLNEFVARNEALEWGVLRTGNVGISGTDYVPPIPEPNEVEKELTDLLHPIYQILKRPSLLFYGEQDGNCSGMETKEHHCCWPIRY